MPLSNNFYLAPGPGYGVFVRAPVGHQTCIFIFARFRADLKSPLSVRLAYIFVLLGKISVAIFLAPPYFYGLSVLPGGGGELDISIEPYRELGCA